jgi:hypothetical protein
LRFAQEPLRLHSLGCVARDLGEADDVAAIAAQGVEDDRSPEARAVLAQSPAFRLVFSLASCSRQSPVGEMRGPILLGVETAEVRADDFLGRIAFDALRAAVPARDVSIRVEVKDGVVDDAFNHLPEARFGLQKPPLGLVHFRHVADDLDEAQKLSVVVPDRVQDREGPKARSIPP